MNNVSAHCVNYKEADLRRITLFSSHYCKQIGVEELVKEHSVFSKNGWKNVLVTRRSSILSDNLFDNVVVILRIF